MNHPSFIERAMDQWRIVLTLTVIFVGLGVYSFMTMQRQEFGDFTIRQGIVVGVMPGATSEQVEEQLTGPVEDFLFSFNEVNKKKTYSISKDGQVVVFVELNDSVNGLEAPAFWAKLRHGLNELKSQKLSSQVLALIGNNDFGDTSALIFTVVAEGRSPRDLKKYVEVLQSHLRRIDATAKLNTYGEQQEVIRVSISADRLMHYGIRTASVWASLQSLGGTPAPARLDGDDLERPIHLKKVLRSESELANTIILSLPTGPHVRLKDIADIKREYGHDDAWVRYNGKTAMVLSIEMQSGNDITAFGDDVERALEVTRRELPKDVVIARVADQPKVVRTSVNHFLRDFGLAIASVILVTMLLLPFRVASVAAITIPICVAITLAVLDALNVKLETVSLAGLIVVLGMIVDNAIVIIDDYVDKLDRGMDRWTAAVKSARELTVPVLTATIAIILSYVPMPVFMKGAGKDFIGALPLTIGVALVTSMAVSLLLVPAMNYAFIRRGLHREGGRRSMLDWIQKGYDALLEFVFRHSWIGVVAGVASVVVAGLLGQRVPQEMFPKIDRNQFAVEVYLPNGRSLKQTDQVIRRIEKELLADKRVVNVTAFVGQSSPRFHTMYAPQIPSRNYGQLVVNTLDEKATLAVLRDSEKRLKGVFPEAWVRWKQLAMDAGNPVEVRLIGDDIVQLQEAASKIMAHVRTIPGTTWVRDDYEEALQTIEVAPDPDTCSRLGVPPAFLEMALALGTKGFPLTTIWEGDYPVRVLVKDQPTALQPFEQLRQQYVSSTLGGVSVPLEQLATMKPVWHQGAIVRRNGVRTLTVNIDLAPGVLASVIQKKVESYVASLSLPGVEVGWGGERALTEEVLPPQVNSMIASIVLIFIVLLFQFQRFSKALLVMLSMPLSLLGACVGLYTMGYPFSLTSFMGLTGLFGLVVRNGIILVAYAEQLQRDQGLSAKQAALAAGKRRMRPIYLTSMAAAIGVVPMILGRSTLWGPLGTVTCFGLLFSMILTLFVLPVFYAMFVRDIKSGTPQSASRVSAAAVTAMILLLSLYPTPATAQNTTIQDSAKPPPISQPESPAGPTTAGTYGHSLYPTPAVKPEAKSPVESAAPAGPTRSVLPVHDSSDRGRTPILRDELASAALTTANAPLTLAHAKALSIRNNSAIHESALEIEAAEQTKKAAYTKYFPQVSAGVTGMLAVDPMMKMGTKGADPGLPVYDGNPATLRSATQFAYFPGGAMEMADRVFIGTLTAIQPIYVGDRITNGNKLAQVGIEVAKDKSKITRREVLAQTEDKYWRIVGLKEKLRTLEAYEKLLAALDAQVSDAFKAGLVTRNDQLKVQLKIAEVAVDRERLESGLRLSARDLRQHLGLAKGDTLELADQLPDPQDPARLFTDPKGAIERRPEMSLLSVAERGEELQKALKKGEMLPTVSVGAGLLRLDVHGMMDANNAFIFGMVNVPLSGIWEGVYTTASQEKRLQIVQSKRENTRQLLGIQIDKSWADLRTAWHSVKVSEKAVQQAEVNINEVSDRQASGLIPFSDLLEARALQQQSFDRRIDTRVDYWLKRYAFLRSIAVDEREL